MFKFNEKRRNVSVFFSSKAMESNMVDVKASG